MPTTTTTRPRIPLTTHKLEAHVEQALLTVKTCEVRPERYKLENLAAICRAMGRQDLARRVLAVVDPVGSEARP